MSSLLAIALIASATPAVDEANMPSTLLGRYEADPALCRIADSSRNDSEENGQGSGLLVIEGRQIYWVEWLWPVRSARSASDGSVAVELVNDVNGDESDSEIVEKHLVLQGNVLTISDSEGATRYYRCPKHRSEGNVE